jgi:hypothetical protein
LGQLKLASSGPCTATLALLQLQLLPLLQGLLTLDQGFVCIKASSMVSSQGPQHRGEARDLQQGRKVISAVSKASKAKRLQAR